MGNFQKSELSCVPSRLSTEAYQEFCCLVSSGTVTRLATEQLEILNIIKPAKILAGFPLLPLNADNLFCVAPEQLQIGHGTVRDFEHYIDPCLY